MVRYDDMRKQLEDWGCTLLSTEEEFINTSKKCRMKIKYVASCGHECESYYHNMQTRMTHFKCKACINKIVSKKLSKDNENNKVLDYKKNEYDSIEIFQKYLGDAFVVSRTRECCFADLLIKRHTTNDKDEWTQVQLKSTSRSTNNQYSFTMHNKYAGCILICISLNPEKMWIFKGDDTAHLTKIAISSHKHSIYDKNEVTIESAKEIVDKMIDDLPKVDITTANIPLTINCRKEHEYALKRVDKVRLSFEEPEIHGRKYDFIIKDYNLRVQEKVGYALKEKKHSECFGVHKSDGQTTEGKRRFSSYDIGDADVYWLNSCLHNKFYVIPESKMIEFGYVGKSASRCVFVAHTERSASRVKLSPYCFKYDDIDYNRLQNILRNAQSDGLMTVEEKLEKDKIPRIQPKQVLCMDCKVIVSHNAVRCLKCKHKYMQKYERPPYEKLLEDKKSMTYDQMEKKYGIPGNRIRKIMAEYKSKANTKS